MNAASAAAAAGTAGGAAPAAEAIGAQATAFAKEAAAPAAAQTAEASAAGAAGTGARAATQQRVSARLRWNNVLNQITRRGTSMGNSAGVLGACLFILGRLYLCPPLDAVHSLESRSCDSPDL